MLPLLNALVLLLDALEDLFWRNKRDISIRLGPPPSSAAWQRVANGYEAARAGSVAPAASYLR